ncbi:type VII secretion-associated protein [Gordonia sp. w5E2]|uniref:type VII secretion-associated protein n=1 Tax=Gordonia TaxID=2053 RepID=UPI0009FA47ED|nr:MULTISPECIES: type VII secretion-associated protein [Gordonia]
MSVAIPRELLAPAAPTAPPVVVDLAYGEAVVDTMTWPELSDVTFLLDHIDAAVVTVAGASRDVAELWREVLWNIARSVSGRPILIGHPSTWGSVRCGVLSRAAAGMHPPVSLIPRAVLVARSHSDTVMGNCVVVETTHRPSYPADTVPPTWDVARMVRTSAGWAIERSGVITVDGDAQAGEKIVELIDDSIEAVFVDGADRNQVRAAIEEICAHTVAGRVVPVDRGLVRRHGARTTVIAPLPEAVGAQPEDTRARQSFARRYRLPIACCAALVVGLVVLGVVGWGHHAPQGPAYRDAVVGRTTLSVPAAWHHSAPPMPGDPTDRGEGQTRSVFTDPGSGGRILLVQSDVRSASTLDSVANSLRNRISQRGDDVVSEFSASTRFGDREVIAYREAPASGSAIRWYVLVDDDLQVSIGCQAGSAGESVDAHCARAVSTVRIVP